MFDINIVKIQYKSNKNIYCYNIATIIMDTYYIMFLVYLDTEPCMQTW